MKRGYPPLWFGALLLAAALCWRILGAPVSLAQLGDIQTPLWQIGVLTPSRVQRILALWMTASPSSAPGDSLAESGKTLRIGRCKRLRPANRRKSEFGCPQRDGRRT